MYLTNMSHCILSPWIFDAIVLTRRNAGEGFDWVGSFAVSLVREELMATRAKRTTNEAIWSDLITTTSRNKDGLISVLSYQHNPNTSCNFKVTNVDNDRIHRQVLFYH